jgi:deoxyribonuclease-4
MKFGAHMSTSGGVWKALDRGVQIGCEVVQLFVKNNMQWLGKPYQPADLVEYRKRAASARLACIFGHAGYLINLAAPPCENRDKSIQSLIQEVQLATWLDLPFLVLHPGAHLGAGETAGIELAAKGLDEVMQATSGSRVRIALENTAGQGSCLGNKIQHLAEIYAKVKQPERLGVCLDTAHFLAAGYDIRTVEGWNAAIHEVEALLGSKEILAFHLNDSKTDLGSRVDRHEHIGKGKIGRDAFRHIVTDERFHNHPGCLETPKSNDLHEDVKNLAVLRSLTGQVKPDRRRRPKAPLNHHG